MSRKGLLGMSTIMTWGFILLLIFIIAGIFFFKVNADLGDQVVRKDGLRFEGQYFALSVANQYVRHQEADITIAELLSTRTAEEAAPTLSAFLRATQDVYESPAGDVTVLFMTETGRFMCPGDTTFYPQPGQGYRTRLGGICGLDISRESLADGFSGFKEVHEERFKLGNVGVVPLPNEEPIAVVVIVHE